MRSKVTVKDNRKRYDDLIKRVFGKQRATIEVGILEADGAKPHGEGLTVLDVATFNEFGLGVPERSFLRAWFDDNRPRAMTILGAVLRTVVSGQRTKEQALELLGARFVAEIQKRIAQGILPPNSEETIKKKGSSVPLIDTGQLRTSITYRVTLDGQTIVSGRR